jgi:hypothetical protein
MVRQEGLGKLKKCNDVIWTRARDIPACGIVPQPTSQKTDYVSTRIA